MGETSCFDEVSSAVLRHKKKLDETERRRLNVSVDTTVRDKSNLKFDASLKKDSKIQEEGSDRSDDATLQQKKLPLNTIAQAKADDKSLYGQASLNPVCED